MIRNIKIKVFLPVCFVIIILLMGTLGCMSIYYTQRLANQIILFYDSPHTVQLQLAEIRVIMSDINSQIRKAMIYHTDAVTQETTDFIKAEMEDMNSRITLVKERFTGDSSLLEAADAKVAEWLAQNDKLRLAMEAEKYDEALTIFESSYSPAAAEMLAATEDISDYSGAVTDGFYESAQRSKSISVVVIVSVVALTVVLAILICVLTIRSILHPLNEVEQAAKALSEGDLQQRISFTGRNEFGHLARSMRNTVTTLANYIGNISDVLERMSKNDLSVTVDMEYIGAFTSIKNSLDSILLDYNRTMAKIKQSSSQVSTSSEMLSSSAQALSQGASEQAGSVEELSANITEISAHVSENASHTAQTNRLADNVGEQLAQGNGQMHQMLGAIEEINSSSDQIAKIIKTIEDIAFQTNILALNAAVEAARAGAAGRGFAVVADEVRSLASKSQEAAKSTTVLIQGSIDAVAKGTRIANDTAHTLEQVVGGASQIIDMVAKISKSSEGQAMSLKQVTDAVHSISQVIQTNSATSEEAAATSEEMSLQAQALQSVVEQFQLAGDRENTTRVHEEAAFAPSYSNYPSSSEGKYA